MGSTIGVARITRDGDCSGTRVPEVRVDEVVGAWVGRGVGIGVGEVWEENAYFIRGPSPVNSSEQPAVMMHPRIQRIKTAYHDIFCPIIESLSSSYSMVAL